MTPTHTQDEERRTRHLVSTDWLQAHLDDPNVRIVDMRGYVRTKTEADGFQTAEYLGAPEEYEQAHIPGAIYLDWTRDIVDETDPIPAQAASPDQLAERLGRAGIGDDHLVIAYDSHPASQFATRLWWLLRYYGHTEVRVLNGGWAQWNREERPITAELPRHAPARFTPRREPEWRATAEQVRDWIGDPDVTLIDARDEGQYSGRIRRGKRGGHIPGAIHLPREALFNEDGLFRSPEALRSLLVEGGAQPDSQIVAYCNGGVAATSVLFALSMLGYPRLTNYDGSWNEWNLRTDLPVEQ